MDNMKLHFDVDGEDFTRAGEASGETKRVLKETGRPDYKSRLEKELTELRNSEMWQAGAASRSLRPKTPEGQRIKSTKGVEGRGHT